jgi:hypothetical protein
MTAWVIAEHVIERKHNTSHIPFSFKLYDNRFCFLYISKLYKVNGLSVYNLEANDVWQQHKQSVYNAIKSSLFCLSIAFLSRDTFASCLCLSLAILTQYELSLEAGRR